MLFAWEDCQASRDRNAIYGYLSAVFDLVMWWAAEGRAVSRARWALRLCRLDLPSDEPFAMIILCTADLTPVDKRTQIQVVARAAVRERSTSRVLSHWPRSSGGRVASTNVRRDSPVTLGEVVALTVDPLPARASTGQSAALSLRNRTKERVPCITEYRWKRRSRCLFSAGDTRSIVWRRRSPSVSLDRRLPRAESPSRRSMHISLSPSA